MKTMQLFTNALSLIVACGLTVACTSDEDFASSTPSDSSELQFNVVDAGVVSSDLGSKATTDANYKTTFEKNDVLGLIGVNADGTIIDTISNIQMTHNGSGWTLSRPIRYNTQLKDVKFFAYTPYNADLLKDNLFDPKDEKHFAKAIDACTLTLDQSTKEAYEKNDMMISGGFTLSKDGNSHTVTLTMNHAFSLVSVVLPSKAYTFTNHSELSSYTYAKATNVSFLFGPDGEKGEVAKPYETDGIYNFIVKPSGSLRTLEVNFTNGTERYKDLTIATSGQGGLNEGQYAKYVIDGGPSSTAIALNPGDFYMKDGSIVAKGTTLTDNQKADVVGVIYAVGTSEEVKAANSSWSHARVMSLDELKSAWGTNNFSDATLVNLFNDFPFTDSGNATLTFDAISTDCGYSQTNAWKQVYNDSSKKAYCDKVIENLNNYSKAAPTITSGWYIPGNGDWKLFSSNSTDVNQSLGNAGGTAVTLTGDKTSVYYSSDCGIKSNVYYIYDVRFSTSQAMRLAATTTEEPYHFVLSF